MAILTYDFALGKRVLAKKKGHRIRAPYKSKTQLVNPKELSSYHYSTSNNPNMFFSVSVILPLSAR
jgi:hypothetical protein